MPASFRYVIFIFLLALAGTAFVWFIMWLLKGKARIAAAKIEKMHEDDEEFADKVIRKIKGK